VPRHLTDAQILLGGDRNKDSLYFAPTLLDAPSKDSQVMQDEIFGPLLPVKTWTRPEEAKAEIESRSRPLAFYCFTRDEDVRDYFIDGISFGGGCVNNTLVHLANPSLPFGGVGDSGMGRYHGRDGFLTFSHQKAIVDSALRPDIPLKYPPYKGRLKWLKALIR